MQFQEFADYLQQLEKIPSRNEMTVLLSKLLRQLEGEEITPAIYMLEGRLVPQYQSLEFQLSVKMVLKALSRLQSTQASEQDPTNLFGELDFSKQEEAVQKQYKKLGDVGLLTEQMVSNENNLLNIEQVYEQLVAIAEQSGAGSQDRKLNGLVELFKQIDSISAKFISRLIIGKMRLGFSTQTMIDALSWSVSEDKSLSTEIELAFQKRADLGKLATDFLSAADDEQRHQVLQEVKVEVGIPIVPELCQRLNSAEEIIAKMDKVIAEAKYDGLRVQIHVLPVDKVRTGELRVKAFTRNLEDVTHMFPELQQLPKQLKADSAILDSEAVGFDPETNELLPFQNTITRKRKHAVDKQAAAVPLRFFIFDVLLRDNQQLIDQPMQKRRDVLEKIIQENEHFMLSKILPTSDPNELQKFHEEQLSLGLEGVVIKQINSPYQSGRRSWYWVKIKEKQGTRGKLNDTLDCVVMGYYFGRGKRTQFGIGAFLVGVVDGQNQQVKTIAKIGTGLSDDQFKEMKERSDKLAVDDRPSQYDVPKELSPDVWTTPELVVEIAADELTRSPLHTAGKALRFPRLVKFRDDKSWQQATTLQELDQIA